MPPHRSFLLLACAAAASHAAAGPAFTDVTAGSGAGEIVRKHLERIPDWWLSGLHLIDLDGDGDLDLLLGGHGQPAAAGANDGHGHFTAVDPKPDIPRGVKHEDEIPYPGGEVRLPCDFDEDGRIDLFCSWHDGGGAMYLNAGAAGPPPRWAFRRGALLGDNRAVAVADLDGDGRADLLLDAGRAPEILLRPGKGDGTFGSEARRIPGALPESGAIPVDIDGDGDLDLLVSRRGYNPPGRRILLNDGAGGFTDATAAAGLDPEGGSIHGAGDLDGDGSPDLVCVEGRDIALYLNDGKGRFTRKPEAVQGLDGLRRRPQSANWGGAVVTDLDNDGIPDILVNGRHFLYVLRGTGGGHVVVANEAWGIPMEAWSAVDEGLCFGDIDGDGRLDLVVCSTGADEKRKGIAVLLNALPERNWIRVRPVGMSGNRSAAGAKIRLADPATGRLLAFEQVAIWGRQSFHSSYGTPRCERHFGLGARERVNVSVEFHPSGRKVERQSVPANAAIEIREDGH
jgi:hypothetical protein